MVKYQIVMEKIKQKRLQTFSLVRLYKDDLFEIIDIFERNLKNVSIEADGYKLKDKAQINDLTKAAITNCSIQGNLNEHSFLEFMSLVLGKDTAYIVLTDDTDTIFLGIESQIRTLLHRRKALSYFLASHYLFIAYTFFSLFTSLTIILLQLYFKFFNNQIVSNISSIITLFILFISPTYIIWWSIVKNKFRAIIYLSNYNTKVGFVKRNKDQIILLLIGAILGTIFGSFGTILVTWLTSHIH